MKRFAVLLMAVISISAWGRGGMLSGDNETSETVNVRPLSCHQNLQLSIGPLGYTVISPQMVLSDTFMSYAPFRIMIDGKNTDTIKCVSVNSVVEVKVIDTRNGNSCWSNILVEDKLPPEVTCINDTFPCYVDPFSVDYSVYASASDNCDDSVSLDYAFFFRELGCASNQFVSYVELRWTAEDDQGLTDQCVSLIFFERVSLNSTEFPGDTTISCPLSDTIDFGEPLIDSLPISPLCDLVSFFEDDTIPGRCSGEFEIRREWTVMDVCANRAVLDTQIITVIDTVAPDLICADSITVGTESATCTALYVVPPVMASDACGEDSLISFMIRIEGQGMVNVGDTVELDTGSYDVMIYAEDDCGNIDSCDQELTVVDDVAPVLICIPDLEIYLDSMGNAPDLCLADLDHMNFYFDNCGIDSLFIAKMVDFCDTTRNNQFGSCVEFCCADVGN
ncbi:MAG: hypothetical protein R3275_02340, partial [Saprospiraceae bacterium]|nr:hypothetical protein [Saprospiraceae bacterium]